MDTIDLKILEATRDGIPIVDEPYKEVAARVGIGPQELVDRLSKMKEDKVVRRFAASIDQHKLGIRANAVVAWKVPQERITDVAAELVGSNLFSHCYERDTIPGVWEYNLYTVIHGRDRNSVLESIDSLAQKIRIKEYGTFFSIRGFKTSGSGRGSK
jgi:DNA-binding Lrp family transcriptional regulator